MKKLLIVLAVIMGMCFYTDAFAELQVVDGPITAQSVNVTGLIAIRGGSPGAGKVLTSDADGDATWQVASGGLGGSGTTNYFPIFTGTSSVGNSVVYQSGSNVGIGTTSPSQKLTVLRSDGTAILGLSGAAGNHTNISIGRTGVDASLAIAAAGGQYASNAAAGDTVLRTQTSSQRLLLLAGTGDSVLTVTNSNVGINTTAPIGKLEINSDVQPALNIKVNSNDPVWFWKTGGNTVKHTLFDKSNVGWRFYDDSGELLGIAPTTGDVNIKGTIKVGGGSPAAGKVLTATDSTGLATWQTPSSGMGGSGTTNYIPKFTAGTTIGNSAIYDSAGNVGIGTTSPSYKLDVSGAIRATSTIYTGGTANGNIVCRADGTNCPGGPKIPGYACPVRPTGFRARYTGCTLYSNTDAFTGTQITISGTNYYLYDDSASTSRYCVDLGYSGAWSVDCTTVGTGTCAKWNGTQWGTASSGASYRCDKINCY